MVVFRSVLALAVTIPMPTEPLIAIQAELAQIKTILLVVSSLGGIALLLIIVRGCIGLFRDIEGLMANHFERQASELFQENKLPALKALALERLQDNPNHEYARWYLARTLYVERDFDAALREFSELQRICPSWNVEHISPFVAEIERLRTTGVSQ